MCWPFCKRNQRRKMVEELFEGEEQLQLRRGSKVPPVVYVKDSFLSEEECEEIKQLAEPRLKRATVCGDKSGYKSTGRTGSNCWLKHDASPTTAKIVKRVAGLLGVPPSHAESLQVIYYGVTQKYSNHYDGWLHDGSDKAIRTLRKGGQRIWTALCYLNTVPKGGATRFSKLKREVVGTCLYARVGS